MPGRLLIRFIVYVWPHIPGSIMSVTADLGRKLIEGGVAVRHEEKGMGAPPVDKAVFNARNK